MLTKASATERVAVKTNILNFSYQIIRSFYDEYIAMPSTGNSHLLERRNWVKFDQCCILILEIK